MKMTTAQLTHLAYRLRIAILQMITHAKSGHPGGSLSAIDVMTTLFFSEMRGIERTLQPVPTGNDSGGLLLQSGLRDRFILSKGHAAPALYAIFAELGWIARSELSQLRVQGSRLQGHPDCARLPQVETSTGSLGQGLSVALGLALGLRQQAPEARVFCLLGDGEIQEGQVWEAALAASHHGVSQLCAIIDCNGAQIDGPVAQVMNLEPLAAKWQAFGWEVQECAGHDFAQIKQAFQGFAPHQRAQQTRKPFCLLARTVKGKGVSFMEHQVGWHGVAPTLEQLAQAVGELEKEMTQWASRPDKPLGSA